MAVKQSTTLRWRIAILVLALVATYVLWVLFRPNPLVSSARAMARAMRSGDAVALMDYASSEEVQATELTPEKLRQAWEILLGPVLARSRFVGNGGAELLDNRTQADATLRYVDPAGNPWKMITIANQAEGGPKTQVVYTMLSLASCFDVAGVSRGPLTAEASLEGVKRYRQRLEAIGIHTILLNPSRTVTWDGLEELLRYGAAADRRAKTKKT